MRVDQMPRDLILNRHEASGELPIPIAFRGVLARCVANNQASRRLGQPWRSRLPEGGRRSE